MCTDITILKIHSLQDFPVPHCQKIPASSPSPPQPHIWVLSLFSSVQFSCSVMSDSLWSHERYPIPMGNARPPCPSSTPRVYPNPCSSSQWCHPTISSSAIPFSSCPHSFQASGSFPVSQLFTSGGQSIGVSASASVLPINTQDWSPLGWIGWNFVQSKGLSRAFSGWRGRWEEGSGWRIHVNPWLIHVNVWQKPLQYCKVISLQLIKINKKNKQKKNICKFN